MFESKSTANRWQWIAGSWPCCLTGKQGCPPDGLTHPEVPFDKVGRKYHDLGEFVMPEEHHCLRMMRPEHLWHVGFDHFNVWIPLRCILILFNFTSNGAFGEGGHGLTSMCMPFGSSFFQEPCTTRTCTRSRVSWSKCLLGVPLAVELPTHSTSLT